VRSPLFSSSPIKRAVSCRARLDYGAGQPSMGANSRAKPRKSRFKPGHHPRTCTATTVAFATRGRSSASSSGEWLARLSPQFVLCSGFARRFLSAGHLSDGTAAASACPAREPERRHFAGLMFRPEPRAESSTSRASMTCAVAEPNHLRYASARRGFRYRFTMRSPSTT
jgi:hypothetical protein